jgi:hypothetical protein
VPEWGEGYEEVEAEQEGAQEVNQLHLVFEGGGVGADLEVLKEHLDPQVE